jgi:hypothetical protein
MLVMPLGLNERANGIKEGEKMNLNQLDLLFINSKEGNNKKNRLQNRPSQGSLFSVIPCLTLDIQSNVKTVKVPRL